MTALASVAPPLDDVLITRELGTRVSRLRDHVAENAAYVELAERMVSAPEMLLHRLVEVALELCSGGTAGVSLLESAGRVEGELRWIALAGAYASQVGGTVPADFSPCGDCLRRGTIELYARPGRVYTYLAEVSPPIIECLVMPLRSNKGLLGTIWIMSHDDTARPFTSADAACMTALADFSASCLVLQSARTSAEQASRAKDDFLTVTAHELRGPAAAILGWTEMLLSGRLSPSSATRALAAIHTQARRQSHLIEDLVDLSRIATGHLTLQRAEHDVCELVKTAGDTVRPAALDKRITLEMHNELRIARAIVDAERLLQVFTNALANAVKFTPPGGRIDVRTSASSSDVVVRIADTGAGIPRTQLPHVFEPFRKVDGANTRRNSGLGLGLTIARHLIELHAGRIIAESDGAGCGTTVTITLPLAIGPNCSAQATFARSSNDANAVPARAVEAGRFL